MTEPIQPVQATIGEYADYVSFDFILKDGKLVPNHPEEWIIPQGTTAEALAKRLFPAWVFEYIAESS